MSENKNSGWLSTFAPFATFLLAVAMLRLARTIIIPLALASLLAFLLSPTVVRLTRSGLSRTLSVLLTATLAFGLFAGVAWVMTVQALNVVQELPKYEQNIERKVALLRQPDMPSAMAKAAGMVEKFQAELKTSEPPSRVQSADFHPPVPVVVEPAGNSLFEMTGSILTTLINPLATAGIVVVLVIAMLMQWEDLRARFIKLTNKGGLNIATQVLDDASHRVARYLYMQLLVNASYGIPIGLGLYFIGIPNALLWGLLSTLLRFIPYLGPWIAAAFPVVLAVAIDPGWMKLVWTLGLFFAAEAVTSNFIEVWVYSLRTGISSLGLMVAAVFWTWLWGPTGLILSTPLTVCLIVLGKYLPGLKIFDTLLSNEHPAPVKSKAKAAVHAPPICDTAP
jgi:predicted PurR-regulated permease PerM